MISTSEQPKRSRILEIAIVFSVALHLLLGGFATFRHPWITKVMQRLVPSPKQEKEKWAALSTAIRIEKRTKPRVAPPSKPQPVPQPVPPRPQVVPRVAAIPKPVERAPRPKPTEIAKIVPRAKAQSTYAVPKGEEVTKEKPTQIARIAVPHEATSQKLSEEQIAMMQQRFAQTIAMAKANSDPTRVPPQTASSTMRRAHFDVAGIDELLRRGEGILSPRDRATFAANVNGSRGTCYYVDYQIEFTDGTADHGFVWWPICYAPKEDPFRNHWRGFPLPPPPAGWQPPNDNVWSDVAAHPLLRLYFPNRFPTAQ